MTQEVKKYIKRFTIVYSAIMRFLHLLTYIKLSVVRFGSRLCVFRFQHSLKFHGKVNVVSLNFRVLRIRIDGCRAWSNGKWGMHYGISKKEKKIELDVVRRAMIGSKHKCLKTRPDTRPISVSDGWAGAEIPIFPLFDSSVTDQPTDQPSDRRTDKASYRFASPRS